MSTPAALKDAGNAAAHKHDWPKALKSYEACLELFEGLTLGPDSVPDEEKGAVRSNASLAALKLSKPELALSHADAAVTLRSDWPKARARLAAALEALDRIPEAVAAYAEAKKLASNAKDQTEYQQHVVRLKAAAEDHGWNMALADHGLRINRDNADPTSGRSLAVRRGHAIEAGKEVLRESPEVVVRFDEPFSALESQLMANFNISKIAPPFRLLARVLESTGEQRSRLLSRDGLVQRMAANMEVATGRWPSAFCTFLAEAAARTTSVAAGGGSSRPPSAQDAMHMLAIIKTNAFGIYDAQSDGLRNVGLGLYKLMGQANHECDPSAVWTFDVASGVLVLRALRELDDDDPVTISYLLPREPPGPRQHKLRESYRFDCGCKRCSKEAGNASGLAAMAGELRDIRTRLEAAEEDARGARMAQPISRSLPLPEDLKRGAELLKKLTPRNCYHPDIAVLHLKLGMSWWRLFESGLAASGIPVGGVDEDTNAAGSISARSGAIGAAAVGDGVGDDDGGTNNAPDGDEAEEAAQSSSARGKNASKNAKKKKKRREKQAAEDSQVDVSDADATIAASREPPMPAASHQLQDARLRSHVANAAELFGQARDGVAMSLGRAHPLMTVIEEHLRKTSRWT